MWFSGKIVTLEFLHGTGIWVVNTRPIMHCFLGHGLFMMVCHCRYMVTLLRFAIYTRNLLFFFWNCAYQETLFFLIGHCNSISWLWVDSTVISTLLKFFLNLLQVNQIQTLKSHVVKYHLSFLMITRIAAFQHLCLCIL